MRQLIQDNYSFEALGFHMSRMIKIEKQGMKQLISDRSLALLAMVSEPPERNQNINRRALSITATPANTYVAKQKLTSVFITTRNASHPSSLLATSNFLDSTTTILEYSQDHPFYSD
jgi:hypothetical protein